MQNQLCSINDERWRCNQNTYHLCTLSTCSIDEIHHVLFCCQVSTYSKAVDTPFSSVRKSDVRVSNPGLAVGPAYTRFASPYVSHVGVAAPLAAPIAKVSLAY